MRSKTPRLSSLDQVQALMHLTIFKVFSEVRKSRLTAGVSSMFSERKYVKLVWDLKWGKKKGSKAVEDFVTDRSLSI